MEKASVKKISLPHEVGMAQSRPRVLTFRGYVAALDSGLARETRLKDMARGVIAQTSEVRSEKVRAIQESLTQGSYYCSPRAAAVRLFGNHFMIAGAALPRLRKPLKKP
jgi:Anti-sigma-28 factor, FlgM